MLFNPAFTLHRQILSDQEKRYLRDLSGTYSLQTFRSDSRNFEEMMVDFVYTSAKIEGNTYDRLDTDNLLRIGITAGGKRHSDALMLVNLREGFERVLDIEPTMTLDLEYLGGLHKVLMKDLLPANEQGLVRTSGVTIGASTYRPMADPTQLREQIKFILPTAQAYEDPFEQSIYLHCNLAYLQYFRDGNKRTARLMQTAALVRGQMLPLFFNESLIEKYQRATVGYYETGDYAPYVGFFKENYLMAVTNLLGYAPSVSPVSRGDSPGVA